ncbi:MAG: histone deacetylase family protein, partial [Gammaproteobacteria bacterium]|nr:histone deacetylase family protein [Gammaproteobacteria bacterium]
MISHTACLLHDPGPDHPERARRLSAINDRLVMTGLADVLRHYDAPEVTDEQLLRVHTQHHLDTIASMIPESGYARLDPDTVVCKESLRAARRAAGALVAAVDLVCGGDMESAFCCVRPPGHHAESDRAMGFCLYSNVAVGAAQALNEHGIERLAVVDFDVHHGNGTEEIFQDDERVLFCSTFQHPFYPYTPVLEDAPNRVNVPLAAGAGSDEFRAGVTDRWMPALRDFEPQMIFVSAGFDAHLDDDMSMVNLTDADYRWVSEQIVQAASASAGRRIVSALEGGYELNSLARCVE